MGIRKYAGLLLLIAIILSISMLLISCKPSASGQQQSSISEEELEQIQQAIEEEEADDTDYGSVIPDAEIYGYVPSYMCTDTDNYVKVEVTNNSDFTWRASGENRVRIGYHYYGQDVDSQEYDNPRSPLPENLEPGESATVEVLINQITEPGTYVVQIDLVLEGHYWFSSKEVPMLDNRVYFNSCLENRDDSDN